ncbi:MAG: class I SAM-dependent methyltransferase [Egibacteraceae bacterium]
MNSLLTLNAGRVLRSRLVEAPGSFGERSRLRRWETFRTCFPDAGQMRVIDLGGTTESWIRAPVRPLHVCVLNLAPADREPPEWITPIQGDACAPPEALLRERFDLVFSNSLIEHVGGHFRRAALADAIARLASRHWVQTPYRYFPIEPHWLFPGFQFLPLAARAWLSHRWPLMHTRAGTQASALAASLEIELLSRTEMTFYFPDSRILDERVGPLTKSLIAIKLT